MEKISPREYLGKAEGWNDGTPEQESNLKLAQTAALVSIAESLKEIMEQLNRWSEDGRLDVLIHDAGKF